MKDKKVALLSQLNKIDKGIAFHTKECEKWSTERIKVMTLLRDISPNWYEESDEDELSAYTKGESIAK